VGEVLLFNKFFPIVDRRGKKEEERKKEREKPQGKNIMAFPIP